MDEERRAAVEKLKYASPLEMPHLLKEVELYDAKTSQQVIDEVYEQFESGDGIKDEVLKPVFMSVIDGLLEATAGGRAARKKGLTASRVMQECESFEYDNKTNNVTSVNGYTEYKNAEHSDIEYKIDSAEYIRNEYQGDKPEYKGDTNSNMASEYNRKNYEDKKAMNDYKEKSIIGEKTVPNEYTGKNDTYAYQNNPDRRYNDDTHRKQAQPDHIVPLKQIHDKFKNNYALDDSDIKRMANIEDNLAMTSADINQVKKDMTNEQYIEWMDEHGKPLDEQTKKNMLNLQNSAEKAVDSKANEIIAKNLLGKGEVDEKTVNKAYAEFEANNGRSATKQEKKAIKEELAKKKTTEIRGTAAKNAAAQAKDYAVGNLILFIVKPIYYELSDSFKNGLVEGVNAGSGGEALKIRFGRVKDYVLKHGKAFLGDNMWDFVKGFVSSLVEGIIGLFVGMFKQVMKILKEGVKIISSSLGILFGKESKNMSPVEKGDAIIKLVGGSVIAISGVALESLINKIGIVEPWSVVISTILSGIASALFMYILDKADIFSIKAEKRHNRIMEIYEERIKDVEEAERTFNVVALETLRKQREEFEDIRNEINDAVKSDDIESINGGLYKLADYMDVDLPYSNTEEFCDYMDSEDVLLL